MSVIEITAGKSRETLSFEGVLPLSSVTASRGLAMPCGGHHTCGKCKIRAFGALSPLSPEELRLLSEKELSDGVRLACCAQAVGDCSVILPDALTGKVLLEGQTREVQAEGWNLAADIGTTTIAVYACRDGKVLRSTGALNAQSVHGADVISRIGAKCHEELHRIVVDQLTGLFLQVLGEDAAPDEVQRIVITGNTTMLHFLAGYDPSSLAVSPFTPVSLFGEETPASRLFPVFENARLYLPPCISAYVGGDMVCAMTDSRLWESGKTTLMADIGTNGEMALFHNGKLCACSTAAGPALEGACIHMGMAASSGAIDRVTLSETGELCWHTIGDAPAKGLCGSGLISLIACLVQSGQIDETGALCDPVEAPDGSEEDCILIGDSGVFLTQKDIRQVQLAKAAICAGILTMLEERGIAPQDVERFFICGGFGSYIDPHAASVIGLFPAPLEHCVQTLGNAAGAGAVLLLDETMRDTARRLQQETGLIELSSSPVFMEEYIEQMCFSTEL